MGTTFFFYSERNQFYSSMVVLCEGKINGYIKNFSIFFSYLDISDIPEISFCGTNFLPNSNVSLCEVDLILW